MAESAEPVETSEPEIAQSLLGELLEKSRAYRKSAAFKELLDFAVGWLGCLIPLDS